jgi:hypothetical protein
VPENATELKRVYYQFEIFVGLDKQVTDCAVHCNKPKTRHLGTQLDFEDICYQ